MRTLIIFPVPLRLNALSGIGGVQTCYLSLTFRFLPYGS